MLRLAVLIASPCAVNRASRRKVVVQTANGAAVKVAAPRSGATREARHSWLTMSLRRRCGISLMCTACLVVTELAFTGLAGGEIA